MNPITPDTAPAAAAPVALGSLADVVTPAPPLSRADKRREQRIARATAPKFRRTTSAKHSNSGLRMLVWGLVAMLTLGVGAVLTGSIQFGPSGTGPADLVGGKDRDGSWSYYHDTDYDTRDTGAKWSTDRSRSTDPAEAALGDTTRWEYDGPYRYGPYGSDAMRQRAKGTTGTDAVHSSVDALPDVFTQYGGNLDPSGGMPVGMAPSALSTPYYDPYAAGYANPYANRIRMAYGEGIGRGAYDPLGG